MKWVKSLHHAFLLSYHHEMATRICGLAKTWCLFYKSILTIIPPHCTIIYCTTPSVPCQLFAGRNARRNVLYNVCKCKEINPKKFKKLRNRFTLWMWHISCVCCVCKVYICLFSYLLCVAVYTCACLVVLCVASCAKVLWICARFSVYLRSFFVWIIFAFPFDYQFSLFSYDFRF